MNRSVMRAGVAAMGCVLVLTAGAVAAQTLTGAAAKRASARIEDCRTGDVLGFATLYEAPSREGVKDVSIGLFVSGLTPGRHAVHIHQTAKCEPCGSAGGHFDPGPNGNTSPDGNHPFHAGDLVNIDAGPGGFGLLFTRTTRVSLSDGPLSLFDADGSAFIIHDNEDTYCPDGVVAGCAGGSRAACGIIVAQ